MPKDASAKCIKDSYSVQAGISAEARTLAGASRDNINRRVESFLKILAAQYKGLPALKAELAIQERDLAMLQESVDQLRAEVKCLEAIGFNTEHRRDLEGYDSRVLRVVEDIHSDPSLRQYLVDRAHVIAKNFNVDSAVVEQDIRAGLS